LFTQRFAKAFAAKIPCSAGLMCLAVCIEAATVGLIQMESEFSNSSKAGSSISSSAASEDDQFLDLKNNPSKSNEIGGDVLDSLQLVLEKSNGHFDQDDRAKGEYYCSNDISATVGFPYPTQYASPTYVDYCVYRCICVSSASSMSTLFSN